jgi:hypothetical protein
MNLVHAVGGERRRGTQGLGHSGPIQAPLAASRWSLLLGLSLSAGEAHHQDPLRLERGLVLWWHAWLGRGSDLRGGKLALS